MKTIWKRLIQPNSIKNEPYDIRVPAKVGARALSVGIQNGKVCVWFEVDPEKADAELVLYSVGTGFGCINSDLVRFIGTVIQGQSVWHIYAED